MTTSIVTPSIETVEFIKEAGGAPIKSCYQCGLCTGTCPWNSVRSFPVRKMIHEAQLGLVDFEDENWWFCVTCKACVNVCPRNVNIIDVMRAMRRIPVGLGMGYVPEPLRITLKNIAALGNPMGESREKRANWATGLGVETFAASMEVAYFSCCVPAYDPKTNRMARSLTNILKKAKINFGIIGSAESCCGESVRKAGNENLFQSLAQSNMATFKEKGVKQLVVSSPHCYHAFKNEYPEFGANFEVLHYTQYLLKLIQEGRIKLSKEHNKKVTYHDPCYLGRHNNIYETPREILRRLPGLEFTEMPESAASSLCCGGGGGRIWEETKRGERFSDIRIEQAIGVGARVLATACPYCILNFDDSVLTMNKGDAVEIRDIAELVDEVM